MRSILIALVLTTGVVVPAAASIIQVPSAHSTIQAGINAAAPGDTVQVAPGTYTGASNRNLDFAGKNILLRSSAGAATTIIDCQNLARGMRFHSGETAAATVRGFTIRNGLASGTFGGGILVEGGATPTIRDCRFESNHANTGGAVFVSSSVTLTDCTFDDNVADNFGGGGYVEVGNLTALRCSFTHNQASIGAGVSVILGATATLTDCTFTENIPVNKAGGLYTSVSTVALRRCTFLRNEGKNGAGGYLTEGAASVDSCSFTSNTAYWGGGGLYAERVAPLSITGSSFEGNTTLIAPAPYPFDTGGGGLYMDNYHILSSQIVDCTFINNQTIGQSAGGASGGGMNASGFSSDHVVLRCTFIDNHAYGSGGGAIGGGLYEDCVFQGNTCGSTGGGLAYNYESIDCVFTNNQAKYGGGRASGGNVIRCEFTNNLATSWGGGMTQSGISGYPTTIEDCRFSGNQSGQGGAIWAYLYDPTSISGCTFDNNIAGSGSAAYFWRREGYESPVEVSGCTAVRNQSQAGGAFHLRIPVQIANTIIAFGTQGVAVTCEGPGVGVMSCTDIFGNAGGDWTSCISDQVGINGNFSLDPRFCNVGGGDFRLAQTSPCTAANAPAGCGLIGAYPVGCATPIGIADAGAPAVGPVLRVTPNPMRGAGMIEWVGVGGLETELRLYDVAGRIVARRVETGAGGELPWSALVGAREVPSGVYFLEMGERRDDARVRLVVIR